MNNQGKKQNFQTRKTKEDTNQVKEIKGMGKDGSKTLAVNIMQLLEMLIYKAIVLSPI